MASKKTTNKQKNNTNNNALSKTLSLSTQLSLREKKLEEIEKLNKDISEIDSDIINQLNSIDTKLTENIMLNALLSYNRKNKSGITPCAQIIKSIFFSKSDNIDIINVFSINNNALYTFIISISDNIFRLDIPVIKNIQACTLKYIYFGQFALYVKQKYNEQKYILIKKSYDSSEIKNEIKKVIKSEKDKDVNITEDMIESFKNKAIIKTISNEEIEKILLSSHGDVKLAVNIFNRENNNLLKGVNKM